VATQSREELTLFCQAEYPSLVGLLGLYCGDLFLAEELAQEALARACRDWRKVRAMDRPDAWLRRVAMNLAKSRFRRRHAEHRANQRLQARTTDVHEDPDTARALSVRQAISALPHRQKAVLILHYYGDLTLAQVAEVLDCSEGTVKSLAHRAVQRLRHESGLLESEGGIEWHPISES
jgi:RNA polymerase sigma-70 factor (sigma-E family)